MSNQNIAIIGLGKAGTAFLGAILNKKQNVNLVCIVEPNDTTGKAQAVEAGVKNCTIDEIAKMGKDLDIIFDLSGNPNVTKELRHKLNSAFNAHTVVAPDSITRLVWALIANT
ncbi:MAG: Gfo/Idh/MocA family oxidoreductase [Methylophilales bacterium]|nr:Gfo/Idh/MocA family oxidoreductase [Methylophilales bacterium]